MLNLKEKYDKCWYCENFYGSNYNEPICWTCHCFLFPDGIDFAGDNETINSANNSNNNPRLQLEEKLESNDSGNEDSVECFENQQSSSVISNRSTLVSNVSTIEQQHQQPLIKPTLKEIIKSGSDVTSTSAIIKQEENCCSEINDLIDTNNKLNFFILNNNSSNTNFNNKTTTQAADSILYERILELTTYNKDVRDSNRITSDIIDSLPNEVLITIFKNLDDLSLWSASLVCKRWYELIENEIDEFKWKSFVFKRWLLYKPSISINCWQTLYSQLIESSNCVYCLKHIFSKKKVSNKEESRTWRHKRLLLELKALQQDPPDGIHAKPLDSSCYYWQAAITGPNSSPYEGGIFYLYLQIPQSYPLRPPLVRFITKIFHPNISRHGDIGLDSIHDNWSLALTISKVLISIQSLLTDPYTHVCMENEIGHMYRTNRQMYEQMARMSTWKYAMSDYLIFNQFEANNLNQYLKNISNTVASNFK